MDKLVERIQAALLKQSRHNRTTISLNVRSKEIIPQYEDDYDLRCCDRDMEYKEVFGIRRYSCAYRSGSSNHPVIYVRQSDGEMLREEDL